METKLILVATTLIYTLGLFIDNCKVLIRFDLSIVGRALRSISKYPVPLIKSPPDISFFYFWLSSYASRNRPSSVSW